MKNYWGRGDVLEDGKKETIIPTFKNVGIKDPGSYQSSMTLDISINNLDEVWRRCSSNLQMTLNMEGYLILYFRR